jgi:hypothetical protein
LIYFGIVYKEKEIATFVCSFDKIEPMKKILALLLLSPLAFSEDVVSDLIGKTWIESSANDVGLANHHYRFFKDGRFYAMSKPTDDKTGMFIWNGAYEMRKSNDSFSIYSDDMKCDYFVSKIGTFYRLDNYTRNFSNICPDLLVKDSLTTLK